MNSLNTCTLEAAQRLVVKGIVLETEAVWEDGDYGWFIRLKDVDDTEYNKYLLPAPSMAEVWRELPESKKLLSMLNDYADQVIGREWVESDILDSLRDPDKMIDLLVWVEGQKGKEKV